MLLKRVPILTVLSVLCVFLMTGCKGKVGQVKDNVWSGDKGTTIGKALDNYNGFEKKKWELIKTDNGKEYVEFSGDMIPSKKNMDLVNSASDAVIKIRKQIANNNHAINHYFGRLNVGLNNWEMNQDALKDDTYNFDNPMNSYRDTDEQNINARRDALNKTLDSYITEGEKIKAFYNSGNRIQLVYQFGINQDKSIDILAAGCRSSKDKKVISNINDAYNLLKLIYDTKSIDGACPEPI